MITVEDVNADINKAKTHCPECKKILRTKEQGLEEWAPDEALTLMMSVAERHIRLHPTHNPSVTVYWKV